jgi:SAM-dependent methyltransferase
VAEAGSGRAGTARSARAALRSGVVVEVILAALPRRSGGVRVLDLGGGTGGLAVQLAGHGHEVTVVDPSPDSLAALSRRAAETATTDRIRGLQGDAAAVADLLPADSVDLVLCHSVLEVVDDPVAALRAAVQVLRPDGLLSLLVANRVAAVAARVASGRLTDAEHLIADPAGRDGPHDPLARRFTVDDLRTTVTAAGLTVQRLSGVRIFLDAAPAALLDDAAAAALLLDLERTGSRDPVYLPLATQLHALCARREQE